MNFESRQLYKFAHLSSMQREMTVVADSLLAAEAAAMAIFEKAKNKPHLFDAYYSECEECKTDHETTMCDFCHRQKDDPIHVDTL